jgi:hypothetical protein
VSHCIAYTGDTALLGVQVCTQNFLLREGEADPENIYIYIHTHIVYIDFKKYVIKLCCKYTSNITLFASAFTYVPI